MPILLSPEAHPPLHSVPYSMALDRCAPAHYTSLCLHVDWLTPLLTLTLQGLSRWAPKSLAQSAALVLPGVPLSAVCLFVCLPSHSELSLHFIHFPSRALLAR